MKLEDQVCSLELAMKLKALGVKQKSVFVWEYYSDKCYAVKYIPFAVVPDNFNKNQIYSAFSVAELGEFLPIEIPYTEDGQNDVSFFMSSKTLEGEWWVNYTKGITAKTEANARALMLIHLIENNIMEVPND